MFQSIRLQITLFFFITTAVSIIFSGSFLAWKQYTEVLEQNRTVQRQSVQKLGNGITRYLENLGSHLQMIADIAAIKGLDRAEQYILLKSLHLQQDVFTDIIFVNKSHEVVHSHNTPEQPIDTLFPSPDEIFQLAKQKLDTIYLLSQDTDNQPHIIIIVPVYFIDKRFINGAVAAVLPLKTVKNTINELSDFPGQVALYSSNGALLTSVSQQFPTVLFSSSYFEEHPGIHSSIEKDIIYSSNRLGLLEPSVILVEAHSFKPWKSLFLNMRTIVFYIIVILIVVLTAGRSFVDHIIAKPLNLLQKGAQQIQQGNYTHSIKIKGSNEFGNLASAFNIMADQLTKTFEKLDSTINRLNDEVKKHQQTNKQLQHSDKLASLGRLSACVAHEFGNPLLGLNYLLKDLKEKGRLNKKHSEMVELGVEECRRMQVLIKDLRLISRPSTMNRRIVSPNLLVHNALVFHKKIFSAQQITLEESLDFDIPEIAVIEDQITQVFFNMINNAINAMASVGGVLTVSTSKTKNNVVISFKDNGSGISSKNIEQIFEPFFSTKPEIEGTGLGLYISYKIINNHGGNIEVYSEPEKGSTFVITIPRADVCEVKSNGFTG